MKALLSATDWTILRVLWGEGKLSPKEICEIVNESKKWSVSTVKTLISRLNKKGYLVVDNTSRYPRYDAKYTEQECIEYEMNHTLLKIYGDDLLLESIYLDYYGYPDYEFATEIDNIVNEHIPFISDYLNVEVMKMPMMIHRTLKNMHSAMGLKNAPEWLRIGENYNMYHIAPKESFTDLTVVDGLTFMISNVVIDRINHGLPFYFKQGLATILSTMDYTNIIRHHLEDIVASISTLTVLDLSIEEDKIGEMRQHVLSYIFVSFLTEKTSKDLIVDIVHNNKKLSKVINSYKGDMIHDLKEFVRNKYQ